ncbi:MAG: response regulator transcription factor [Anaerolineales bacterium]|nr:MAG: response regulator transcription factor [Anaerolineales bacterium]
MQPTKVLIVDDHALFRQGVRNAIECQEEFEIVGEAGDGIEALAKARELKPDLILMDINMPHGNGLETVSAIKREWPGVKIIMLSVHDEDENLFEAIRRGAEGFLSKNVRANNLLDSLRDAMRGKAALSGPMTGKVLMEFARLAETEAERIASQLTPREKQVLHKMSEELTNRKIALSLCISENTVKTHVSHILKKLDLQTRSQAAAYARRWKLHEEEEDS